MSSSEAIASERNDGDEDENEVFIMNYIDELGEEGFVLPQPLTEDFKDTKNIDMKECTREITIKEIFQEFDIKTEVNVKFEDEETNIEMCQDGGLSRDGVIVKPEISRITNEWSTESVNNHDTDQTNNVVPPVVPEVDRVLDVEITLNEPQDPLTESDSTNGFVPESNTEVDSQDSLSVCNESTESVKDHSSVKPVLLNGATSVSEMEVNLNETESVKDDPSIKPVLLNGATSVSEKEVNLNETQPKESVENHKLNDNGSKIFSCNECSYTASSLQPLTIHRRVHKLKMPIYQCSQCSLRFTKRRLREHVERDHSGTTSNQLIQHIETDKPKTPRTVTRKKTNPPSTQIYECELCSVKESSQFLLNMHKREHANLKKCPYCSFETTPPKLSRHVRTKHNRTYNNLGYYQCNSCSYETNYFYILMRHRKLHNNNVKIVQCSLCVFKSTPHAISTHIRREHKNQSSTVKLKSNKSGENYNLRNKSDTKPSSIDVENKVDVDSDISRKETSKMKNSKEALTKTKKDDSKKKNEELKSSKSKLNNKTNSNAKKDYIKYNRGKTVKYREDSCSLDLGDDSLDDYKGPKKRPKIKTSPDMGAQNVIKTDKILDDLKKQKSLQIKKVFKCTHCPYSTGTKPALLRHSLIHSNKKTLKCCLCKVKTATYETLIRHLRAFHESHPDEIDRLKAQIEGFSCECGFKTNYKGSLLRHIKESCKLSDKEEYRCSRCGFKTHIEYNFARHKERSCLKIHRCKCGFKTRNKALLRVHNRQGCENDVTLHSCPCGSYRSKYKVNMRRHKTTNCKLYRPEINDGESNLDSHMKKTCLSIKRRLEYTCECGFKCYFKKMFTAHTKKDCQLTKVPQESLHERKPKEIYFKCSDCFYKARYRHHLELHRRKCHIPD